MERERVDTGEEIDNHNQTETSGAEIREKDSFGIVETRTDREREKELRDKNR